MTQREAQKRLDRFALIGVLIFAALFLGLLGREYLRRPPQQVTIPFPKEKPSLALLITANRQGKLEVCGCPGKRAEDLSKVAALLQEVAKEAKGEGIPLTIMEGGDFVGDLDALPYLLRAYQIIGYQAVALSPRDMRHLAKIHPLCEGLTLLLPPSDSLPSLPTLTLLGKGIKVGVINLGGGDPVVQRDSPLLKQIQKLRSRFTFLIAITHWKGKEIPERVRALRGLIDAVLVDDPRLYRDLFSRGAPVEGRRWVIQEKRIRGVPILPLPQSRSHVLELMFWGDGKGNLREWKASFLSAEGFGDEPKVKRLVDEYFAKRQERLKKEMGKILKAAMKKDYLPPEFCAKCHQAQYEQWLTTGHAHAIKTLEEKGRMDKQCLTCHSLEFRMRGVITKREGRGIECVDCHTDLSDPQFARLHGQRPGERPVRPLVEIETCRRCHDRQNSPNFEGEKERYMEKVRH